MPFKAQPFFQYSVLDRTRNTFRLCKLLPAEPESPINCELTHEEIALRQEQYSALSYTWGEATERRWIRLNGNPFHIQPSLMQALKAIRKRDATLILWIDAICIDQSEVFERNHQVSLMGSIYKNASSVFAWLGPTADDSDLVFDYLDGQDAKPESDLEHQQPPTLSIALHSSKIPPPSQRLQREDRSLQQAFTSLIRRPYWRRAWIKQEIILARDIVIFCGGRSKDWTLFSIWATLLRLPTLDDDPENFVPDLFLHRSENKQGKLSKLEDLLERYHNSEAADTRDQVFALLSLASDCQGKESELVDYSLSRAALFFSFLAYFKPANIGRMAASLQEALLVRRVELMKFWQSVTPQSSQNTTSAMKKLAFEYVLEVQGYMELAAAQSDFEYFLGVPEGAEVDLPSKAPAFIANSYFAMTDLGAAKQHKSKLLMIEGSRYYLRVQPTLFGSRFLGIYQAEGDKTVYEGDSCVLYTPKVNFDEVWRYMILPITALGMQDQLFYEKRLVDRVKKTVGNAHGPEFMKPSIEIICHTLYEISVNQTGKCCLIDCRYILTTLYGYKVLRPRYFSSNGLNTDKFGP